MFSMLGFFNRFIARRTPAAILLAGVLTASVSAQPTVPGIANAATFDPWPFPADSNRDLAINVDDLLQVINGWGECAPPEKGTGGGCLPGPGSPDCPGDANYDCVINVDDLLSVINSWGEIDLTGTEYGRAWIVTPRTDPELPPEQLPPPEVREVLLSYLGEYDENGVRIGSNNGLLNGKYGETSLVTIDENHPFLMWPAVLRLTRPNNDFRVDHTGTLSGMPRESHIWASEVQFYHMVTEYRRLVLTDSFILELGLDPQRTHNVIDLQYHTDLVCSPPVPGCGAAAQHKPFLEVFETFDADGISIFHTYNNVSAAMRTRGPLSPYDMLPPISHLYDPFTAGEYAGLIPNWLSATNRAWPGDGAWGQGNGWIVDALPPINDGLNAWTPYQISGNENPLDLISYQIRHWAGWSCGGTGPPCNKGGSIRNVMMSNEQDTSKNGVYPFGTPAGLQSVRTGTDLAGQYVAALFFDVSREAGLGDHRASLLFWKTISLVEFTWNGNGNVQDYPMRKFGRQVMQAARLLWPVPGNPSVSIYEQDIHDVLVSRGIAVDAPLPGEPGAITIGSANFTTSLPPAIGPAIIPGVNNFGSSHPENQANVDQYGLAFVTANGYTYSTGSPTYVSYQFYKHSKYGPCDHLEVTDGTYTGTTYNNDGTWYHEFTDREIGNLVVLSPGNTVWWKRYKQRCPNEATGFYAEDVKPFGFRVIKATANGFSFTVTRIGDDDDRITYQLTIVDPSLNLATNAPGGGGPATYAWTFTEFDGTAVNDSGQSVSYAALRDQPFTISITRTRAGQPTENLTLRERGNDLDRPGSDNQLGSAFVFNAMP